MKKIVLCTGGFDPLHSGHIKYLTHAAELGNQLIVGINSDAWLQRKKGKEFLPAAERKSILQALRVVDSVIEFDDSDGTACDAIYQILKQHADCQVIFANGGDRNQRNIPEMQISDSRLSFAFQVGSEEKSNSSSWILDNWTRHKSNIVERSWGYYQTHTATSSTKLKSLVVNVGQRLSMQRHQFRNEHWFLACGRVEVLSLQSNNKPYSRGILEQNQTIQIPVDSWHQLVNVGNVPAVIYEIQYGQYCEEEDIERQ